MRRILQLVLTVVFLLTMVSTAAAAPKVWRNPNYDYTAIKTINFVDVDETNSQTRATFVADEDMAETLLSALFGSASKEKLMVKDARDGKDGDDETRIGVSGKKAPTAVDLQVKIGYMGYYTYVVPGHYDTTTVYEKTTIVGSDGKVTTVTQPVQRQTWVPEVTVSVHCIDITYKAYDPESGELIYNNHDNRVSDGSTYISMTERSTKFFLKSLLKK